MYYYLYALEAIREPFFISLSIFSSMQVLLNTAYKKVVSV